MNVPPLDASARISLAIKQSDAAAIRACFSYDLSPQVRLGVLTEAAMRGNVPIIQELIAQGYTKEEYTLGLRWAAGNGHLEALNLLLPLGDPKNRYSQPIRLAATNGHLEVVRRLIPVSEVVTQEQSPLVSAARAGHTEIVRELIPVCRSRDTRSLALKMTTLFPTAGTALIIEQLLPVADVKGLARFCFRLKHWAELDRLGPHVSPALRQEWLTLAPSDALPNTLLFEKSQCRIAQLDHASATSPSRQPRRPRS